jgi:hypothetical protein
MRKLLKYFGFATIALTLGIFTPHVGQGNGTTELYDFDDNTGNFSCEGDCGDARLCCENGVPVWKRM